MTPTNETIQLNEPSTKLNVAVIKLLNDRHIVSSPDRDIESIQATLVEMGGLVGQALANAAVALKSREVLLADQVCRGDEIIDQLDIAIKTDAAHLLALFITNNIERSGDHATEIAEHTIYAVTGKLPGDELPKQDAAALELQGSAI